MHRGESPVSYTHLDVYKRQGYESVMWGFLFLLVGLPVYAYMRYKYPQSIVKSGEPAADEDMH